MYSLYGYAGAVKNVVLLSKKYATDVCIRTSQELRSCYLQFLAKQFPHLPINRSVDPFIDDATTEQSLARAYSHSKLNDLGQDHLIDGSLDQEAKLQEIARARNALSILKSSKPELGDMFELVIHSIFFSRSRSNTIGQKAFGGSSSRGVGVIWATGLDRFETIDMVEFFLHELTHHLIFLDEMCHPQFHYEEIIKEENYATSAILKRARPLDKVVHSIIVCTEILLGRVRFLPNIGEPRLHPDTATIIQNIVRSSQEVLSMSNVDDLITGRVKDMLNDCMMVAKRHAFQPDARRVA